MNIKREASSDIQDFEDVITGRRTKRPKKCIDWGFLKSSRKKRKKCGESINDGDGISTDVLQGNITTAADVEHEKLPVDEFQLGKGIQDAYFNFGRPNLTRGEYNVVPRVSQSEDAYFSESTISAYSESDCHSSCPEDHGTFQDHSYAASPRIEKKKRQIEPKKKRIKTENAPRPTTVDMATLAVYRALIDHTYSSISPSSLIDAVMLKHHYICSIQHFEFQEDFSSKTDYVKVETNDNFEGKPESVSQLSCRSQAKRDTNFFKKGGRPKKSKTPSNQQKKVEDPASKGPMSPVENPKFRRKNESPKRSPRIKLQKRETSPATSKLTTVKKGKPQSKKRNISHTKEDEELDSSSVSSKLEEPSKKLKKRRRRNQTGWPTKYKSQPSKSKTSIDKTEAKKPKNQSPKKTKIKNAHSATRDSSPKERLLADIKLENDEDKDEEAVKSRHQSVKESKKESVSTSPKKKIRERRNVKSLYQRCEDELSKVNQHEKSSPKRTGGKSKPVGSLKANLVSCIKPEPHSSDETDPTVTEGHAGNENVSSSGTLSQRPRRKITTLAVNKSKSLEISPRRQSTPSKTKGIKDEDNMSGLSGDGFPDTGSNKSCGVDRDSIREKSATQPGVEMLPGISELLTKTRIETSIDSQGKELSNTVNTSHVPDPRRNRRFEQQHSNGVGIDVVSAAKMHDSRTRSNAAAVAKPLSKRGLRMPCNDCADNGGIGTVESNEVISLQDNNDSPSPKQSPASSPETSTETSNHPLAGNQSSSSTKKSLVSPTKTKVRVRRSTGSPSRSNNKSTASESISSHSPVSRSTSAQKPAVSTRRRPKHADNQCTPCPATPSRKSAASSSKKNKATKNTLESCEHSASKSPPNSPLKEMDPKVATEGIDNTDSSGREVVNPDDIEGSLVPNPKAHMSLRKRVRLQVSSLFKPRYSSKSKSIKSQPSKLVKIKEEVVDENYEVSSSNVDTPTDSQGKSMHQPPSVTPKSKRRRKKLFWGHRKPLLKEVSTVKLSPVKRESYKKSDQKSLKNLRDDKEVSDESVGHPPEVGNEERHAELGLAIIKVETMESDFMHEVSYLVESEETSSGGDKVAGLKDCSLTSNQGGGEKSEIPSQDSLCNHSKSESLPQENEDSELKGLACAEKFYDDDSSCNYDVMYKCGKDVSMMEPEVVFPPLENLDYTGWKNTKTIYATDVSDSELEDGCSISEDLGPCRDAASGKSSEPISALQSPSESEAVHSLSGEDTPTSTVTENEGLTLVPKERKRTFDAPTSQIMGMIDFPSSSNDQSETKPAALMKTDHPEPENSAVDSASSSPGSSVERRELDDDPTSTMLLFENCRTSWNAKMKRRAKLRKLRQRRLRQQLKRLRAKRQFLMKRRAAEMTDFYGNTMLSSNVKKCEFDSTFRTPRKTHSPQQRSIDLPEDSIWESDSLIGMPSKYHGVVDLTKMPEDSIQTRDRRTRRQIFRDVPSILRRSSIPDYSTPLVSVKEVEKHAVEPCPHFPKPASPLVISEDEVRPVFPKPVLLEPRSVLVSKDMRESVVYPPLPVSPKPCTEALLEEIRAGVLCPAVPKLWNETVREEIREGFVCPVVPGSPIPWTETVPEEISAGVMCPVVPENSEPCTVAVVGRRLFDGAETSSIVTSTDAEEIQNQDVDKVHPVSPIISEEDVPKLNVGDTLPGVPDVSNVMGNTGSAGFSKVETVENGFSTRRGIANRESLQINNEHAYCRKNKLANNAAPNTTHTGRVSVRICEGKLRFIGERANYAAEHANYTSERPTYNAEQPNYNAERPNYNAERPNYNAERPNYNAERVNYFADKLITKKFPLIIKQKPVTVSVPKTVTVQCTNFMPSKPHSSDPYDLSGIVAPLSTPNPADVIKAAIRSYAPGNSSSLKKLASQSQKTPVDPLGNIGESDNAVSNVESQNYVGDNVDSNSEKIVPYYSPPEIERLDVLVRQRLKLPSEAMSYVLRKDGRPPFSYQTMAAMAIEADPLKSARPSDVFDFIQKHFPFYRSITSRWWKQNVRTMLSTSKIFRSDRIGHHAYYSFTKELRLPGDPAIYEMTDEPTEKSDESEDDEETTNDGNDTHNESGFDKSYPLGDWLTPQVDLQEPTELDPLIPICSYSDDESDGFPVVLDAVTYTGDELSPHDHTETYDHEAADIEIKEEPDEGLHLEEPWPGMDSPSTSANHERVYECPYCPAVFTTLQGNLDHSVIHPEVMKPCPLCDFSSPDEVQLLWHVNAAHAD